MLKYKNYSGIVLLAIFFSTLYLGIASLGYSQQSNGIVSNSGSEEAASEKVEDAYYSITLNSISVKKALEIIANEANMRLAYCSDFFKNKRMIAVNGSEMSFDEVMQKILSRTELDYKVTETDHLVIFNKNQNDRNAKKSGTLKGEIIDNSTGKPLFNAEVYLQKKKAGDAISEQNLVKKTYVDSEGRYDLHDIDPGTYRMVVMFEGQKKVFENISIRNATTIANFEVPGKS